MVLGIVFYSKLQSAPYKGLAARFKNEKVILGRRHVQVTKANSRLQVNLL